MKNNKQIAYSRKTVNVGLMKRFKMLGFLLAALLIGIGLGMFFSGEISMLVASKLIAGGVGYASIIGFASVNGNVENEEKVGKKVKSKLYFIEAEQYDDSLTFPTIANRELGNIPLKAGQYWKTIDSILDSPEVKWKGSAGDIAASIVNTGTFVLGGISNEVFELLEKGIGRGFYVVWEICSDNTTIRLITGSGCKPAKLKEFDGGSDKDKTGTTVTFEAECGTLWVKYVGTTPTQAAATVAADATTITLTSNPEYQLTTGSAASVNITAFTGVSASDIGRIVTIKGSGGTYPSTIDTGDSFIVSSTWTADSGKEISFRVYKDTNTYKFVETSRN